MGQLHGVETIELTAGTVAVTTIETAIIGVVGTAPLKRRTKNAKTFHDKCENFTFRASNETAALTAVFLFIKWDHFGYG